MLTLPEARRVLKIHALITSPNAGEAEAASAIFIRLADAQRIPADVLVARAHARLVEGTEHGPYWSSRALDPQPQPSVTAVTIVTAQGPQRVYTRNPDGGFDKPSSWLGREFLFRTVGIDNLHDLQERLSAVTPHEYAVLAAPLVDEPEVLKRRLGPNNGDEAT